MSSGELPWWVGLWEVVFVVALWLLPMWVGGAVASRRGRHRLLGVAAGALLGWVGVLLLVMLLPAVPPSSTMDASG